MRTAFANTLLLAACQLLGGISASASSPEDLWGSWSIRGLSSNEGFCIEANSGYYPVTVDRKSVNSTSSKCEIIRVTSGIDLPGSYRAELKCTLANGKPFNKVEVWLLMNEKGQKSWVRIVTGSSPRTWEPCKDTGANKNTPTQRGYVIAPEVPEDELQGMSEDISAPPVKPKAIPDDKKAATEAKGVGQGELIAKAVEYHFRCENRSTMTTRFDGEEIVIKSRDNIAISLPYVGVTTEYTWWSPDQESWGCEKAPCAEHWYIKDQPDTAFYMLDAGVKVRCRL